MNRIGNVKRSSLSIIAAAIVILAALGYLFSGKIRNLTERDPVRERVDGETGPSGAAPKSGRPQLEERAAEQSPVRKEGALEKEEEEPQKPEPALKALLKPSFDIVRVERNGEALIAGQSTPNARIVIESNGIAIADARADETGSFVALPAEPLKGESNQLAIRAFTPEGVESISDQTVAVGVPGTGEPLVALIEPGKAVSILQNPNAALRPEPGRPDRSAQQDNTASAPAPPQVISKSKERDETERKATETVVALGEPAASSGAAVETLENGTANEAGGASIIEKSFGTLNETSNAGERQAAVSGVAAREENAKSADKAELEAPASEPTRRIARLVTSEEAGASGAGSAAERSGGERQVDETPEDKTPGNEPKDNAALEDEAGTEVAPAVPVSTESGQSSGSRGEEAAAGLTPRTASDGASDVVSAAPSRTIVQVTIEAVEVDGEKIFIAGSAKAGAAIRLYVDGVPVGDVRTGENGRWLYEDKRNPDPGRYSVRADQLSGTDGNVDARAEVPFVVEERAVSELADAQRGTIIIRRDDNLWTIAQRLYGNGQRYTAIYQQNRDQIRDPDLIFPGQIFTLPEPDAFSGAPNGRR